MSERESRFNRRKLLQTILFSLGAVGVGVGAKYTVDLLDDLMRPRFVVTSSSVPIPNEIAPWQRPTNWKGK